MLLPTGLIRQRKPTSRDRLKPENLRGSFKTRITEIELTDICFILTRYCYAVAEFLTVEKVPQFLLADANT